MRGQDWVWRLIAVGGEAAALWQSGGSAGEWTVLLRKAAILRRAAAEELLRRFDPDEPRQMAAAAVAAAARLPRIYRRAAQNGAYAAWIVSAHAAFPQIPPRPQEPDGTPPDAGNALYRAADAYSRLRFAQGEWR